MPPELMKAVVLAGGFGKRLRERVPDLPKPMAPIAGRPFLEYILDELDSCGIREIVLSVGYKAEYIIKHFGYSYKKIAIRYIVEDTPLGTGGAIAQALINETNPALVLNGDSLIKIDFREFIKWYEKFPSNVAIVVKPVFDAARYGALIISGSEIVEFAEKGIVGPGFINTGVYIVRPDIFNQFAIKHSFSFEKDILQRHCKILKPRAFITDAYFIDIGVPEDYELARKELPEIFQ